MPVCRIQVSQTLIKIENVDGRDLWLVWFVWWWLPCPWTESKFELRLGDPGHITQSTPKSQTSTCLWLLLLWAAYASSPRKRTKDLMVKNAGSLRVQAIECISSGANFCFHFFGLRIKKFWIQSLRPISLNQKFEAKIWTFGRLLIHSNVTVFSISTPYWSGNDPGRRAAAGQTQKSF